MKDYSAICYKKTFLSKVIIRIDFMGVLPSESIFSMDVEKEILCNFSRKEKDQLVRFEEVNVNVMVDANTQPSAKRNISEGIQKTFMDNMNNKIILSNRAMICEVNNYKAFEDVMDKIKPIILAIFTKNVVTVMRTGIRYINLFDSREVKIRKNFFSSNIAASFENKLPIDIDGVECIRTMHLAEYNIQGMHLNFRYGMYNPDYPQTLKRDNFTLDYDCFYRELINGPNEVLRYIEIGHNAIQTLFENSITDNLRKVYQNE